MTACRRWMANEICGFPAGSGTPDPTALLPSLYPSHSLPFFSPTSDRPPPFHPFSLPYLFLSLYISISLLSRPSIPPFLPSSLPIARSRAPCVTLFPSPTLPDLLPAFFLSFLLPSLLLPFLPSFLRPSSLPPRSLSPLSRIIASESGIRRSGWIMRLLICW